VLTSRKILFSLLITIILFTAFTVFAFIGLFDLIETHFYNPSITAHMTGENNRNAKIVEEFFKAIENRLSDTLKTDAVRRSLMYDQNQEDFSALYSTFSLLGNSFGKIQWVRLIDSSGKRLYFSTYGLDIINHDYESPVYQNYNDPDLPYNLIAVQNGGAPRYTLDGKSGRILFSFALYDSFDIYCGTALFSLALDTVLEKLFIEGRVISGYEIMLVQNPPGMVFRVMTGGENVMSGQISSAWETTGLKPARITSSDSNIPFILISTKISQDLFVGSLIKEELYLFPWNMKLLLLVSFFLTMFLSIFLLFSLKQDPVTIIQSRLKRLQVALLEQFYESKSEEDWSRWKREMDHRKGEINVLLKQDIKPVSAGLNKEIDNLINKSWGEFLSLLGRREPGFDAEKLRAALNSMLAALPKAGRDMLTGVDTPQPKKAKTGLLGRASAIVKEIEETEPVEELEELEELEEPEEIEELEELEEFQEVEEFDSKEIAEEPPPTPEPPSVDLDALASEIEFGSEPAEESASDDSMDDSIEHDLEIVSPFAAMLDGFTDTVDYGIAPIGDETLEVLREGQSQKVKGNVIKEKEGIPFVSADALNPNEEDEFINQEFKTLVDSVIKD